jgi:hypothetical protein
VEKGEPGFDEAPEHFSGGLLQMSQNDCASGDPLPSYALRTGKDVANPRKHLQCGVEILRRQLFGDNENLEAGHPIFTRKSYWGTFWRKVDLKTLDKCLKHIPGYKFVGGKTASPYLPERVANVPVEYRDQIASCGGLANRRVLSQFWENYPWYERKQPKKTAGVELCGRRNHFAFCGELKCAK